MTYNKKLAVLSSICAVLALVYVLSVVFEPERSLSRSAAYTWLDPKLIDRIDRIALSSAGNTVSLARKNNEWFVSHNGKDYPAKQLRVEDFIGVLTARAPYPVRSNSAASHERLSLAEGAASRIVVSGGAGLPLLDLLVGQGDNTGREVYLRRQGENEVRSGEDKLTVYISAPRASWYNLRLFPEGADNGPDAAGVQRLTIFNGAQADTEPVVFTRNNREWASSGLNAANLDMGKVDAYIREIFNTEGVDFDDSLDPQDPVFNQSRLTLEMGDGGVRTLRLSPGDESGRCYALVSGSPCVYVLASWAVERLFKDPNFFERQ